MLAVENLIVTFTSQKKAIRAVRGLSFSMRAGEAVGIVGESGSGKSAAIHAIGHLSRGQVEGKILFEGQEGIKAGKTIGMVFQDPMSGLNPTMRIGTQIAEGLIYHKLASKREARQRALELLDLVGIPVNRIDQYPHELSGGMRQRVLIAIAIAGSPRLLIADEPTTALDVTIQAQILGLIKKMQQKFQMGLLLVSHDFGVIAKVCEKVMVMYAGKIVESGTIEQVLNHPKHPYTQMLLRALPYGPKSKPLQMIEGSPPDLSEQVVGCSFKNRCPYAAIKCEQEPSGPIACWRV
jgi:oligopeptide transport system ATP-binding protein